jgi:hypothetical protein
VLREGSISDTLSYACRFWINHVADVDIASSGAVAEALELFFRTKAVLWMEVLASTGQFRGWSEVRDWVEVSDLRSTKDRNGLKDRVRS